MSNLTEHARQEMERAGLFSKESDYDGMLGPAVMELVDVFAKQGHSGNSAMTVLAIFERVARYRTLTPITPDKEEWFFHGDMGPTGEPIWQNVRDSAAFSRDGGKTWYHLDDPALNNGDTHRREGTGRTTEQETKDGE